MFQLEDFRGNHSKESKRKSMFWELFLDFSNHTPINGVRYFGERNIHWIERVFWIIVFCISLFWSSYMIYETYEKWQTSPVIVSFDERMTPIWQIPFPAITICPETKVTYENLNFTHAYNAIKREEADNLTENELKNLDVMAHLCHSHLFKEQGFHSGLQPNDMRTLLKSISLSISEITFSCKWGSQLSLCEELFTEIYTEEGLCYTFNSLKFSEIYKVNA